MLNIGAGGVDRRIAQQLGAPRWRDDDEGADAVLNLGLGAWARLSGKFAASLAAMLVRFDLVERAHLGRLLDSRTGG